jgi:hypothetical protein
VPSNATATCGSSCQPCATDPLGTATCIPNGASFTCGITCNAGSRRCPGSGECAPVGAPCPCHDATVSCPLDDGGVGSCILDDTLSPPGGLCSSTIGTVAQGQSCAAWNACAAGIYPRFCRHSAPDAGVCAQLCNLGQGQPCVGQCGSLPFSTPDLPSGVGVCN